MVGPAEGSILLLAIPGASAPAAVASEPLSTIPCACNGVERGCLVYQPLPSQAIAFTIGISVDLAIGDTITCRIPGIRTPAATSFTPLLFKSYKGPCSYLPSLTTQAPLAAVTQSAPSAGSLAFSESHNPVGTAATADSPSASYSVTLSFSLVSSPVLFLSLGTASPLPACPAAAACRTYSAGPAYAAIMLFGPTASVTLTFASYPLRVSGHASASSLEYQLISAGSVVARHVFVRTANLLQPRGLPCTLSLSRAYSRLDGLRVAVQVLLPLTSLALQNYD